MSTPTNPSAAATPSPKPRPGLLVEDRNAAVRTADDGVQTIAKVPDRAVEAVRQGVEESKI